MKQFIQRLFGFSLGPVLGALLSLIQVPILTYFLSAGQYGYAGSFQTLLLQIPSFIYLGIDQAYTREYHQQEDKVHLLQQSLVLPLALALLVFIAFWVFAQDLSQWIFSTPEYDYLVMWSGVWVFGAVFERFLLLSIRMEEKALQFSMYSFGVKLGVFLVSLALIAVGMRDFKVVAYGLIFGHLLMDIFLMVRFRHYLDLSCFYLDPDLLKQLFHFGFPLMVALFLSSALNSVDMIFLTEYASPIDRGIYSLGLRIAGVIGIIRTAFTSFWVPTAYRWYGLKRDIKHYAFISHALLLVLTFLFFGVLAMKKPLGWLLSSQDPNYQYVQYIIGLLCFPHIMYTLSETTTLGIVFSRRTHYNIYVSLVTFALSLGLNSLLTPSLGYRGAAMASTLAYFMFYGARTYFSSRSGFYFSQRRQVLVIACLTLAALINAYPIAYVEGVTLVLGLLSLAIQAPTLIQAWQIYQDGTGWDFS